MNKMDFKKLSRVNDSTTKKVKDSKVQERSAKLAVARLKRKIKDELEETETTEDAVDVVKNALQGCAPEDVITCAVEILAESIDVLQSENDSLKEELADSKKQKERAKKVRDKKTYRALKRHIKDELEETETTEDAVEAVTKYLENQEPEDVVKATVEVMAEVVEELAAVVDSKK